MKTVVSGRSDRVNVPVAEAPPALETAEDAADGKPAKVLLLADAIVVAAGTVPVLAAVVAAGLRVMDPVTVPAPLPTTIVDVDTEKAEVAILMPG